MEKLSKTYAESYIWRMKFIAKCLKEDQKQRERYMENLCNQVPPAIVIDSLKQELIHTLLREREEISEWMKEEEDPVNYCLPHLVENLKSFINQYDEYVQAKERVEGITHRLKQLGVKDE